MATKSNRRIQIQSGGGSLTPPKIGGSDNYLERLMYAQSKGMMDAQMKQQERGNISQDIETVKQQFGGNVPPGTTLTVGGVHAPLNRELTESEMGPVAAGQVYPREIKSIKDLIRGGVLNSEKGKGLFNTGIEGNADRTVRQMSAQSQNPLMTYYDPKLQELQSKLAKAKELMFERGGKALTPAEISIVGQAFVLKGKSDDQIIADIDAADDILEAKVGLVTGGANAIDQPQPNQAKSQGDMKSQYNQLRAQGLSAQDARRQLGL